MSNVAKLKKEAADLEQKKQFDKAVKAYQKLFAEFEKHPEEVDVALYNRVGDIQVKLGQVAEAADTYEKGVDVYAEGGFFNNAIALCNKILRQAPGRSSIYYKLGKVSAQKGFKTEARTNFLEYADRMQKAGNTGEAFRALTEFLELVPDQDDVRVMLADQLIKAGKKAEAVTQLQRLYERYQEEHNLAGADSIAEKVHALDPSVDLSASSTAERASGGDLIFLDLDSPSKPKEAAPPPPPPAPVVPKPAPPPSPAAAAPPPPPPAAPAPPPVAPELEVTRASEEPPAIDTGLEIEPTSLGGDTGMISGGGTLEIEPTSFGEVNLGASSEARPSPPATPAVSPPQPPEPEPAPIEDLTFDMPGAAAASAPAAKPEPEPEPELLDLGELPQSAVAPVIPDAPPPTMDFIDLEPVAPEPPPPPRPTPAPPRPAAPPPPRASTPAAPPARASVPAAPPARPSVPAALPDLDLAPADPSRKSAVFAAKAVSILQSAVASAPQDWSLRRELAEALLESGDRAAGLHELEAAMNGAESSDDLELAMSLAETLGKLDPLVVKYHQKRVEYAFRRSDKPRLIDAYLTLGNALMETNQAEKARAVYQRVLELAPDNMQAQMAIESMGPAAGATPQATPRASSTAKRPAATSRQEPRASGSVPKSDEGFVNLGDWLREDDEPKDTRMVVEEKEPSGDEDADFADMLKKFKQGVAENVDAEDYQSHYDLAIAFKEMGLLDEAIAGFQRALGSKTNRLPTYEALGECFLEKGQAKMASAILNRAVSEGKAGDDQLVGVLYWLGRAAEEQGQIAQAIEFYQRVFVIDIQFKDVADRMSALDQAAR
jgi:tetratricopeptide (TPR) repeat protein